MTSAGLAGLGAAAWRPAARGPGRIGSRGGLGRFGRCLPRLVVGAERLPRRLPVAPFLPAPPVQLDGLLVQVSPVRLAAEDAGRDGDRVAAEDAGLVVVLAGGGCDLGVGHCCSLGLIT